MGSEEELLSFCNNMVETAQEKQKTVLRNAPDIPVEVKFSSNPNGPEGRYSSPSVDGTRPGIYWIKKDVPRPKSDLVALTLHEAVPGHHTQESFSLQNDLPMFRLITEYRYYTSVPFNWLFFTSYGEGWALYAEYLGEEMEMYSTPYEKFGRYASEIHRAVRLVVDTGMHMFNMSRDDAVQYMKDNTVLSDESVENEINRYISFPGQACAYKIGELKLKELRTFSQKELGSNFDVRDFHNVILTLGNSPISAVEEQVKSWVAKVKSDSSGSERNQGICVGLLVVTIVASVGEMLLRM